MLHEVRSSREDPPPAVSQNISQILQAVFQLTKVATGSPVSGARSSDRHLIPQEAHRQIVFAVIPPGCTIYGMPMRRRERASGKFFP